MRLQKDRLPDWRQSANHPRLLMVLALAVLLSVMAERTAGRDYGIQLSSWLAIVPVVIGSMVFRPQDELLLGGFFIGINVIEALMRGVETANGAPARLAARTLVVGLCVWTAHLRTELRRQRDISLKAAAMAHEIRQPLTALQLNSRHLLHSLEQMDAVEPRILAGIKRVLSSTDQLGETMVVMTALLGNPSQPRQTVDLAAVLRELLSSSLADDLGDAGVQVRSEGLEHPQIVAGRPEELRIVCRNVVNNAIEALQAVPVAQRQLLVTLHHADNLITLRIADSGPGLPALDLEKLQLRSSKPQGMGLGLHTAAAILGQLGGRLALERSTELGGAAVVISFPDLPDDSTQRHDAARQHAPARLH
jgi:signal transduction histidine kinase